MDEVCAIVVRREYMKTQAKRFAAYMEKHPLDLEDEDTQKLIEYFGNYYRMCHQTDREEVREKFRGIEPIMKSLSRRRENRLFHTMLDICESSEKAAFFEGLRVGAQLIMELDKP